MKVIVIGLGSMGRRRIRLLKQYDKNIHITGVDTNHERSLKVASEYGIEICSSIEQAVVGSPQAAFVCTSPLSHKDIIHELLQFNLHIFTEINLVTDGYDEFIEKENGNRILFLSSTFLYRKDINYIIEEVKMQKVNYCYHTGQYLPDWHPWESYNDFFVKDIRTNGCREILAIELPWIVACFGRIKGFSIIKDNLSTLNLKYPDNYLLQIEHESGSKGQISVDVVARKAMRRLEVYNENLQIFWNGTPDSLETYNIEKRCTEHVDTYSAVENDLNYCENIIENAYMDEIAAFFECIRNGDISLARHHFSRDKEILDFIDKLEK